MDIFALKNVVLSFFKFEFIFLFHEFYVFHDFFVQLSGPKPPTFSGASRNSIRKFAVDDGVAKCQIFR